MKPNKIFYLLFLLKIVHESSGRHLRVLGSEVRINSYSFFAQIHNSAIKAYCGGTIIGRRAVITISSCATENPSSYVILVGSHFFNKGKWYKAINIYRNDVILLAILVTDYPFLLSDEISILGLPKQDEEFKDYVSVKLCGFGAIENSGNNSQMLHDAKVSLINYDTCKTMLHKQSIGVTNLCTKTMVARNDACTGDEGGPLVYNNKLIGIILPEVGCGDEDTPTEYIKVSSYIYWIKGSVAVGSPNGNRFNLPENSKSCAEARKWLNWSSMTRNSSMEINCSKNCNRKSNLIRKCFFNPIDDQIVVTSASCLRDDSEFRTFSKSDQLTVKFNERQYNVDNITFGSEILPYFSDSKHDIAIIRVSEPLRLQSNISTFNVFPIYEHQLPSVAVAAKRSADSSSSTLIPVDVVSASHCMEAAKSLFPFKILLDMFCVIPKCRVEERINICSDNEGAPVFDKDGFLLGVVIWEDKCDDDIPAIALPVSKYIKVYRENSE